MSLASTNSGDVSTLVDYADSVVEAVGDRRNLVVVGHSYGAFTE
jgi:pimeloyl-ACP methyl ester carboxylesterase